MGYSIDWSSIEYAYVYGFSYRKYQILKRFIKNVKLHRVSSLVNIPPYSVVMIWGMKPIQDEAVDRKNFNIIRVEDGFLRSVGLGAALTQPISWVFDDCGMYFNARQVSRLEIILNHLVLDEVLAERAHKIKKELIRVKLSKYNLLNEDVDFPDIFDKKKILVIGQVEGDASLEYGSPLIKKNIDFIRTVYESNSQNYIVYRPHPDVVSGWREDSLAYDQVNELCDQICSEGNILDWIEWADEIHVMTSLTGFEALIRGKDVYCYGLPFYSGWGLTHDYIESPRYKRKLTLLELIAGALIIYPSYKSIVANKKVMDYTVEDAIMELSMMKPKKESLWINILKPFLKRK